MTSKLKLIALSVDTLTRLVGSTLFIIILKMSNGCSLLYPKMVWCNSFLLIHMITIVVSFYALFVAYNNKVGQNLSLYNLWEQPDEP